MTNSKFYIDESKEITNFEYPVASTAVTITPDQRRFITLGVYKPAIKFFEFANRSMKFERHLVSDGLKVLSVVDDGDKFVVLRRNRCVEFHTKNGLHETLKLPYQAKDMVFNNCTSDLYLCGNYSSIYRFNLEQGRFLRGIENGKINKLAFSNSNGLLLGIIENRILIIDSRVRDVILEKEVSDSILESLDISNDGFHFSISSEDSQLLEYDLRIKEPVSKTKLSEKIIKLKYSDNDLFIGHKNKISFQHEGISDQICFDYEINDFDVCSDFLIVCGENKQMSCFTKANHKNL